LKKRLKLYLLEAMRDNKTKSGDNKNYISHTASESVKGSGALFIENTAHTHEKKAVIPMPSIQLCPPGHFTGGNLV